MGMKYCCDEYQCGFFGGVKTDGLADLINQYASKGWILDKIVPNAIVDGETNSYILIFKIEA